MGIVIQNKQQQVVFDKTMTRSYHAYLSSDEWREKRQECIINADFCCEECGAYLGWRGQVHHSTYENLFEEDVEKELRYCCEDCHA